MAAQGTSPPGHGAAGRDPIEPGEGVDQEPSLPTLEHTSVLSSLLDSPLVVVDVGCRWGFADRFARLGERCRLIGFEPDAEEHRRLSERYRDATHVRVEAVALGSRSGPATLHVTKDPSGSSLLPTRDDVIDRHPGFDGGHVERTVPVELTTLDEWCAANGVGAVDVLKIDTQGTELDVLQGAVGALGTARAIEVEVEVNPMYEGAAVFGDVDGFLRRQGFELWRLRDLAHYAQHGAPTDRDALDSVYFDTTVVRYRAGAGQLFWANAFYLHRQVTHLDQARGWEELVRDGCIAGVLGFPDLADLALARATEVAPAAVASRLEEARADEAAAGRHRLADAEDALRLQGPMVVAADDPAFHGWGWQPPQRVELGPVRWTGPAREAWIDLAVVLHPGTVVEVLVIGALSQAILDHLALEVNRVVVPLTRSPHEVGLVFAGRLPSGYSSDRRFTRILLRTVQTVPWCEVHPDSTDDLELGVAVSWVRLTPGGAE